MGSPLGSTLANAFLCHYEKTWLNECPSQFKPVVYKGYVDDIFVLLKSKDHLKLFVNYMNSKHRNIKFTFETEDSNNFSFLDVKITRQNKRFVTSIFRKATFSGVFTNYDTYRIGLIHTLLFWFFKICSSMENFHIEVELWEVFSNVTATLLILLINVSKCSSTNCMSLNRLYQQYLERNC